MIWEILRLLITAFFGTNLKLIDAADESDSDALDPVPPVPTTGAHHAPPTGIVPGASGYAPNILIPNLVNADNHGPASAIARAMIRKGYEVYEKGDFNLNIVPIRNTEREYDVFKCSETIFYKENGIWRLKTYPITTYPGDYYTRVKLLNPKGVAILVPGQYKGAYQLRPHRGVYQALCQTDANVRVYRDGNRDRIYDLLPDTIQDGEFGINRHATENPDDGVSVPFKEKVASASAGCLVNARVSDFVEERGIWRQAREIYGNKFTLTLLEDTDLDDAGEVPFESVAPQTYEKGDWAPPAPFTTGMRNRNIMNVKQDDKNPWKYSTGKDSKNHAIFPSYTTGLRAGIINLRSYWTRHNLRTLAEIINRYAPASDTIGSIAGAKSNDPGAYANFLAKQIGIPATSKLMIFHDSGAVRSADQLYALVKNIIIYECGHHVQLPRSVFDEALALITA